MQKLASKFLKNHNKNDIINWMKKVFFCTLSIMLLGLGCGINLITEQGADPITVFYDGLSNITGFSAGEVANVLNVILILLVFFINKKYVNIGTVIYLFMLGTFLDIGSNLYVYLGFPNTFEWQVLISLVGCLICFIGLGGFMAVDIGIDPWAALTIIINKKVKKSFRMVKIIADLVTLALGWFMGGKVGIITLFCAVIGGPAIQKSYELIDKLFNKMLESKCK